MAIYTQGITFELITPGCCSVPFMMPDYWIERRKDDHKTFWCPNCESPRWWPPGASEKEKLQARLDHQKRLTQQAETEAEFQKNSARAQKAAKTRLKNRISNGVCPCCNRHFDNLHRHMQTKHGDWLQRADTIKVMRTERGLSQADIAKLIGIPAAYVSKFERHKQVPVAAVKSIEQWMDKEQSA